jgi:DNA-binding MarR family transcriptional regulator/N-acetylglutamate synthase-like GNAT family acetyltransferase
MSEQVEHVRRFNRTVTRRVGALDDEYLATGRPLGASRLLWEIGPDGAEVRGLRTRLGLDSGHLSRLLRRLEDDLLVRVEPDAADRRVRVARLTAAGRRELELLDRRSDDLVHSMLGPLRPRQREELVAAMATVERLLTASMVELREIDPDHEDARACVRAYFEELRERSGGRFDPGTSIPADRRELIAPRGAFVVAYLDGRPVGCGGVKHPPGGGPAEVKRMWVRRSARGLGLGRRLLEELEARALRSGASTARLETNDVLVEALGMYRSAGYEEVPAFNDEPFGDHWFEKPLR